MKNKGPLIVILVLSLLLAFGMGVMAGLAVPREQAQVAAESSEVPLPDGRTIKAPAGHRVNIMVQEPDRGEGYSSRTGYSKGGYARGTAATTLNQTSITAPSLDMAEGQEGGTAGLINAKLKGAARSGTTILIYVGILLIVAGVAVLILLKLFSLGLTLCGAGGALIGIALLVETYPAVLLVGAVIALGIVAYFLYRAWRNSQTTLTLNKVVGGIEKAKPATQKEVKAKISEEARTQKESAIVKGTVTKIKQKL